MNAFVRFEFEMNFRHVLLDAVSISTLEATDVAHVVPQVQVNRRNVGNQTVP
jgi:hypothetical protein